MDPMRHLVTSMPSRQQAAVAALCREKLKAHAGTDSVTDYLAAVCGTSAWPAELSNPARWPGLGLDALRWLESLFVVWTDQFDEGVLKIDDLEDLGVDLYGDIAIICGATPAEAAVVRALVFDWERSWPELLDTARDAAT